MLDVEEVPIDRLFLSPSNPRDNDMAVPHVAASLRRFGWQQPVVAKRSGEVIAGNTRLKAATELGFDVVPVLWFDGTDVDAAAFSIADNRTHEFAEWDDPALGKLLQELRAEDALDGVGYSSEDVDELLEELNEEFEEREVDDPGPEEPPETPVTQPGDLWVLGQHRLFCGDSTNLGDVQRVMTGEKAALVATDPPYLVDYTGERPNGSGKDWSATYKEAEITDAEGFFRSTFSNVLKVIAPHVPIYCWHAHKRQALISQIWEELGILNHQQIVWVKPSAVFGRVFYHFRHEPCAMGWVQGSMPEHDGNHEHNSVWEFGWGDKARLVGNEHPTQKPVEIFARPMRKHTKKGDVCFEPFCGSGSQLVAAESLGRRCYAMELEPAFVDVALKRWQEASGEEAVLESSGQSFSDVEQARLS